MGRIKDGIKNYLGLESDIKGAVDRRMGLNEMMKIVNMSRDVREYYNQVNKAWYMGNTSLLEKFYKGTCEPYGHNTMKFWKLVSGEMPRVHYPIAISISKMMGTILFADDITYKIDTGNQKTSKAATLKINDIFDNNDIRETLLEAAQLESYSGGCGFKFVMDKSFSDFPIIQIYPQEKIELVTKYGKILEVVFKDIYSYREKEFMLRSFYGKGIIYYKLFNMEEVEVPLNSIPDTEGLETINILNLDGMRSNILLAVYKKNRIGVGSNETCYGSSDYENLYDIFDTLDETLSLHKDYIRNSRTLTFLNEEKLEREEITGETKKPNSYGVNTMITYNGDVELDRTPETKRDILNLDVTAYQETFNHYLKVVLQTAGLSEITFGFDGVSSLSSDETLRERQRTTMGTRNEKEKLWNSSLEKIMRLACIYDDILNTENNTNELDSLSSTFILNNDYDYDFLSEFPQYDSPSKMEQLRNLKEALEVNLIDLETAYHQLYDDEYTEDEVLNMISRATNKEVVDKKNANEDKKLKEKIEFSENKKVKNEE